MKKIKVGIVGLGRMGLTHAENLKNEIPNIELIALCSEDQKAFELQKKWNIPFAYGKYEDLLKNPEINAVVIVTPTYFHPQNIAQALDANKHVFCEKPLGSDLIQCQEIVKKVLAEKNKVVQIGFMRRHDYQFQTAKKLLDENKIGNPILLRLFSADPEKNINDMFKFGPTSGGQFVDVSAHDVDLAVWYLKSYPRKVFALGSAYKYNQFLQWNDGDVVSALIEFENKTMAFIAASRIDPQGYQASGEIIGTNGHLHINNIDESSKVQILNKHGLVHQYYPNFNTRFEQAYKNELKFFIQRILDQDYNNDAIKDGLVNIYVTLALKQSFETQKPVEIKYWFD